MEPPPGFIVKRGVRGKPSGDLDRAGSMSSQAPGTPTANLAPASASEDSPFGFGAATAPGAILTGSVAAYKRRCEWFYVDPAGEEHGPVPFSKLLSWYKKGHFPEDVKVCVGGRGGRGGGYGWGWERAGTWAVCRHACMLS